MFFTCSSIQHRNVEIKKNRLKVFQEAVENFSIDCGCLWFIDYHRLLQLSIEAFLENFRESNFTITQTDFLGNGIIFLNCFQILMDFSNLLKIMMNPNKLQ